MIREKGEQPLTKEPSKDFRTALRDIISDVGYEYSWELGADQATELILALCKEMLVQGEKPMTGKGLNCRCDGTGRNPHGYCECDFSNHAGWNDYNDSLLKQLGE
jgi:hypothetical protein